MDATARLIQSDAVERLWQRDPSLFSEDLVVQDLVANRLGWLGLGTCAGPLVSDLKELAQEIRADGIRDVILLGMGGSSLAPLVMSRILPTPEGMPRLRILDTSSPVAVSTVIEEIDPGEALFVMASKSGSTIEPNSLYAVFREWMDASLGREAAGRHFLASTDRGSSLEALARDQGFRTILTTPADVGGRYSALTAFGLAPAALIGVDVDELTDRAAAMEEACRRRMGDNPGADLAAWMVSAYEDGHDKLTLVTSPDLQSFGLWVEQLIAESTGKSGKGLIPIIEYDPSSPTGYGDDRMVVVLRLTSDETLVDRYEDPGNRIPIFDIELDDALDLGGEFVRWEVATALTGYLMGIDPFDEPNVTEAKQTTAAIMAGKKESLTPEIETDGVRFAYANLSAPETVGDLTTALRPLLGSLDAGDYLAVLAYLPDDALLDPIRDALREVSRRMGVATAAQIGPRYLHSTGQLHKGGPNRGAFMVMTVADQPEVLVPGRDFTLGDLFNAQADGDMVTLAAHGRRAISVELPNGDVDMLTRLAAALRSAC